MVALDLLLFAYTLARKYYIPKLLFSELFSPKNYFTTKALFGYQIPPRHISRIRFFLSEAGNAILFFRFLLLGDPGLPFFGYIFVYSSDWFSSLIFSCCFFLEAGNAVLFLGFFLCDSSKGRKYSLKKTQKIGASDE